MVDDAQQQPAAVAVLVPVKAFAHAKLRLAPALDPDARIELAQRMAATVLRAAGSLATAVVCDDEAVQAWAHDHGAEPVWTPGLGLNGAVEAGIAHLAGRGFGRVVVAHADLPLATDLAWVADFDGVTLVPDRHGDGTNVACVPTGTGLRFAYGAGSFARHRRGRRGARAARARRARPPARLGRRPARRPRPPVRPRGPGSGSGHLPRRGPVSLNLPTPSAALAIGAHPDDVEFGCGATLAKWSAAGCTVHHLICTDGSKGSWDPEADTAELVVNRQHEQRAAAAALGATGECVFLGWPDGELDSGLRQRWQVAYWIRRLRPAVVLGHDPWKRYRLHPDHRHAGLLAVEGLVAARDPHFFPEQQLDHHRPEALLLFEADEPDHVEDVAGFVDAKLAALWSHTTQLLSTMGIDASARISEVERQRAAFDERIRAELADHGARAGVAQGEAFKRIDDV